MNKKITRANASLKISNDVLAKIAEVAATEIRGVAANGEYLAVPERSMQIPGIPYSPVKITMKNDHVEANICIVVLQGYKSAAVANAVQQSVKSAIQNMAGVSVSKVNVKIADIKLSNVS